MRTVKTQDLTPGMITAEPVLSKHGQLIVAADTELTNQMIAHLSYYNIPSASILDGTIPPTAIASMQKTEQVTLSYSQKIDVYKRQILISSLPSISAMVRAVFNIL